MLPCPVDRPIRSRGMVQVAQQSPDAPGIQSREVVKERRSEKNKAGLCEFLTSSIHGNGNGRNAANYPVDNLDDWPYEGVHATADSLSVASRLTISRAASIRSSASSLRILLATVSSVSFCSKRSRASLYPRRNVSLVAVSSPAFCLRIPSACWASVTGGCGCRFTGHPDLPRSSRLQIFFRFFRLAGMAR